MFFKIIVLFCMRSSKRLILKIKFFLLNFGIYVLLLIYDYNESVNYLYLLFHTEYRLIVTPKMKNASSLNRGVKR